MTYTLRPSASSIWTKCAANPRISSTARTFANETDAAREGTCAAWVAEQVLKGQAASCLDMLNAVHENGWVVDHEMVYHVQGYVDKVRSRGGTINAEQFVRLTDEIAGTYDSSTVSGDETTLYGDDLKYGYKIVDVYECTQLIIYLYAEYIRLNNPKITHAVLGIYQPRAYHPEGIHRTWRITIDELYQRARDIAAAGQLCQDPNAPAKTGFHCEYCKGRGECATLAADNYANYERVESAKQGQLSAEELSNELTFLERAEAMLKARKTAIEAEANERIGSGEFVRGWGQEDRYGHRKFKVDLTTVHLLTGIDPYVKETKTPAQIENEGGARAKKLLADLTYKPRIGHKLKHHTERDFGRMFRDRG
jgi:hypothetical protein